MSSGKPLMAITAMSYSIRHIISQDGHITPSAKTTLTISDDTVLQYPFDTNAITMNMITQFLEGKIDESKFSTSFDAESVGELKLMKKQGLRIDTYAPTEVNETESDDGAKYFINTYETKPDVASQVLKGYLHLKYEKHKDLGKWVPKAVVESEVYTPKGELGYYYVGWTTGRTKDIIFHAWVRRERTRYHSYPTRLRTEA